MIQLLNSQHPKGETLTFTCLINFVNFFTDLCVFRIFFSLLTSNHLTVAITITIRHYEGAREWKWENHFHYSMKINYFVIIFQFICSQSDSWPLRGVISNLTLENISHWTDSMFALIANLFPINLLFSVGQTNAETLLRVRFRSDPSVDWMNAEYWTAASVGYDDRCGWSHRARYTLKVPSLLLLLPSCPLFVRLCVHLALFNGGERAESHAAAAVGGRGRTVSGNVNNNVVCCSATLTFA